MPAPRRDGTEIVVTSNRGESRPGGPAGDCSWNLRVRLGQLAVQDADLSPAVARNFLSRGKAL